jgi:hypothetical protein
MQQSYTIHEERHALIRIKKSYFGHYSGGWVKEREKTGGVNVSPLTEVDCAMKPMCTLIAFESRSTAKGFLLIGGSLRCALALRAQPFITSFIQIPFLFWGKFVSVHANCLSNISLELHLKLTVL